MAMIDLSLVLLAVLGSGLIAGVFFAFSNFVMPALARISPEQGLSAMQSINITVLNPGFLGTFMGTAVLSVVIIGLQLWQASTPSYLLMAGALSYLLGCFAVTAIANVPRNKALVLLNSKSEQTLSASDLAQWQEYLQSWTFWNHIRTAASALAMLFFVVSIN